jgi:hypothetical protein
LIDDLAAFFADAGVFAGNDLMSDARRFIAGGTNELNFASVKGHFLRNDAAVGNLQAGFAVAFNLVDTFDDDFAFVGHCGNNFALLALVLARKDDDRVALLDVKFNQ